MKYKRRDPTLLKGKNFNNVYVKNFPNPAWTDADLRKLFEPLGKIVSAVIMKNPAGESLKFGFVCFSDPANAVKAVEEYHNRTIDNVSLYVVEALSKAERQRQVARDSIKFKNSKKRCNLYVRNFAPETTEEVLRQTFGEFGEIESIKLYKNDIGESTYAFICFKLPDSAQNAKNVLHGKPLNVPGRNLYVNNYEIKELRRATQEDMRDKSDFQNYSRSH